MDLAHVASHPVKSYISKSREKKTRKEMNYIIAGRVDLKGAEK